MKGIKPGECWWNYIRDVMAVWMQIRACLVFHPPLVAGTRKQTPWQMPMELHVRKMSRVRVPPSQPGQPERCSSDGRAPPPRFITSLLPRLTYPDECLRNYIAPNRDHPRVQLPFSETPRRKTIFTEMGAGPQTVSYPLSSGFNISGKCWWNYILSRVRAPPLISLLRVAQLVEQNRFTDPLLPDPISPPGECWLELHS